MKRVIKFRGQRVDNGDWVYGSLLKKSARYGSFTYIQTISEEEEEDDVQKQVHPESVGQFASLFDKNGNEVYEGDVLESAYHNERFIVKFWEGGFCGDNSDFAHGTLSSGEMMRSEIIGNIYENPELLK